MKIESIKDKRLAALVKSGGKGAKGIDPKAAAKIWRQLSAIQSAATPRQIEGMPGWNVHELTPGNPGVWALWVTGNYRLTFRFHDGAAHDLNFEDYH